MNWKSRWPLLTHRRLMDSQDYVGVPWGSRSFILRSTGDIIVFTWLTHGQGRVNQFSLHLCFLAFMRFCQNIVSHFLVKAIPDGFKVSKTKKLSFVKITKKNGGNNWSLESTLECVWHHYLIWSFAQLNSGLMTRVFFLQLQGGDTRRRQIKSNGWSIINNRSVL